MHLGVVWDLVRRVLALGAYDEVVGGLAGFGYLFGWVVGAVADEVYGSEALGAEAEGECWLCAYMWVVVWGRVFCHCRWCRGRWPV